MRKIFKTAVASVATTAMAVTLLAGYTAPVNAEVVNTLAGKEWTHVHESYEANDALIANTTVTDVTDGFNANISITGWQRCWESQTPPEDAIILDGGWADMPEQLRSSATASVVAGQTYELKLTITNEMVMQNTSDAADKNVTIIVGSGIAGDTDNTMINKTVTVPAKGSLDIVETFTVPASYAVGAVEVKFSYGAYAYSRAATAALKAGTITQAQYDTLVQQGRVLAPNTSEPDNLGGKLSFSNIQLNGEKATEVNTSKTQIDIGIGSNTQPTTAAGTQTTTVAPTTVAPTTAAPTTVAPTTVAPTTKAPEAATTKAAVKKPGKVTVKKATNLKGKKVKITWKKVKGATKYQVKVGTKKKTTKKLKLTVKVAKKATYKVRVRAYAKGAGYGKWSKAKKVKVTK